MLGHRPNWFWKIMWAGVSPLLLIALFLFYIVSYIQGGTPTYQAWNKDLVSSQVSVQVDVKYVTILTDVSSQLFDLNSDGDIRGTYYWVIMFQYYSL